MITYEVLLNQIEKHVNSAKTAASDQLMREQVTAVRALCDVLLNNEQKAVTDERVFPQVHQQLQQQLQVQGTPLRNEDANGDSIFDF